MTYQGATKTNHWFQDRAGKMHKRTSHGRVYSHAVIVKWKREQGNGRTESKPEYRSTKVLADALAQTYRNNTDRVERVDVYQVSTGPLLLAQLLPRLG